MKLGQIPLYPYQGSQPFQSDEEIYSERYILDLMAGLYNWASLSQLDPLPVFYNYLAHLDDPIGVYLERIILPDLSTLQEEGYGMPIVWTADPYAQEDLAPISHHPDALLPILSDHGKNYVGNYIEDLKQLLSKLLGEQGFDENRMDWWAQDFKELTWQSGWSSSGIWSEYGSRDDGVNRYNLLTDHVEMLRVLPRSVVQGVQNVAEARLTSYAGSGSATIAPWIWNGLRPTTAGLKARLANCWVYETGILWPEWDLPENPTQMRFLDLTHYGPISDGCGHPDGWQVVMHDDGWLTIVINRLEAGRAEIKARYGDGRNELYSPFWGMEFHTQEGLDYQNEAAWPFSLVFASDDGISFATFSIAPPECQVRSRMEHIRYDGVCLERYDGFAKEGRAWEWRLIGNPSAAVANTGLRVEGWGVGIPGTGTHEYGAGAIMFRPTGCYMRMASPNEGEPVRATDSYPPPEQYWKFTLPEPYLTWTLARTEITQDAGRGYLHLLLVENPDDYSTGSGGVTVGKLDRREGIAHAYFPLPNSLELQNLVPETEGIYSPPMFTLTTPATVVPIAFPARVTKRYTGRGTSEQDHDHNFQYWTTNGMFGAGTGSQWIFVNSYWREDTDTDAVDLSITLYNTFEQMTFYEWTGPPSSAVLTDLGWANLRSGASSTLIPDQQTIDNQIQDIDDDTVDRILNTPGLLNWHGQGGILVSGIQTQVIAQAMVVTYSLVNTGTNRYDFEMNPDGWWTSVLKTVDEQGTAFIGLLQ